MYRTFLLIIIAVQVWSGVASSLAPEHELQRLLIIAKENLDAEDDAKARQALERIVALDIDAGANYYFYLGKLEANSGNIEAATSALIEYVNRSGSEGEYYDRSLRLITQLEQSVVPESAPAQQNTRNVALTGEREQYVTRLKTLYLTDNTEQALLDHINSILVDNVYVPGRIRRPGINEGLVYKVSVNSLNEVVVQESDYRKGRYGHSMQSLPVFGVDPYLRSDCDNNLRMCWLSHPLENRDRWITIADNPTALNELSKALTNLIRQLQN